MVAIPGNCEAPSISFSCLVGLSITGGGLPSEEEQELDRLTN